MALHKTHQQDQRGTATAARRGHRPLCGQVRGPDAACVGLGCCGYRVILRFLFGGGGGGQVLMTLASLICPGLDPGCFGQTRQILIAHREQVLIKVGN